MTYTQKFIVCGRDGNPVSGGWIVHVNIYDEEDNIVQTLKHAVNTLGEVSIELDTETWKRAHAFKGTERSTGYSFRQTAHDLTMYRLLVCNDIAEHYSSGLELLRHYDTNNDNILSHEEMLEAAFDAIFYETINTAELVFVGTCYENFDGDIIEYCTEVKPLSEILAPIIVFGALAIVGYYLISTKLRS